jgi:phospholipid/cholesterol/gamma-HCH transport system substrate-binding protein
VTRLTRGQKVRLGVFLVVGVTLIVGTLGVLIGLAALEKRDVYYIRLPGVGGLSAGAQVRYHGLRVGRVEDMRITPGDVESVRVSIAIDEATPIKADTTAVLEMQGVTGLRYIELTGGTNDAAALVPGSTIPSMGSTLELLSERATSIAEKIERITTRLAVLTEGIAGERIGRVVDEVEATITTLRTLVEESAEPARDAIAKTNGLLDDLRGLATAATTAVTEVGATFRRARDWIDPEQVSRALGSLERAARSADRRLGDDEAGALVAALVKLADGANTTLGRADLTLLQIKDDLLRALDELVVGAEAFAEFANLLREDPAALIRGRGDKPREIK